MHAAEHFGGVFGVRTLQIVKHVTPLHVVVGGQRDPCFDFADLPPKRRKGQHNFGGSDEVDDLNRCLNVPLGAPKQALVGAPPQAAGPIEQVQ